MENDNNWHGGGAISKFSNEAMEEVKDFQNTRSCSMTRSIRVGYGKHITEIGEKYNQFYLKQTLIQHNLNHFKRLFRYIFKQVLLNKIWLE